MVRCSTCSVFHMSLFCRFFYYFAWFDTVELSRLICPNDRMYDDLVFVHRFRYPLAIFGNRVLIGLSRLLHAHIVYEIHTAKTIADFCRIPIVCMIWYGWIQSPAVSNRQDVRWCSFRSSIPLSIDYVWKSCIDRIISTPSCSYSIWYIYYQNHRRILPNLLLFVWFDTVEFHGKLCPSNKITMMQFSLIDSDINWLCLKCVYWYGSLDS